MEDYPTGVMVLALFLIIAGISDIVGAPNGFSSYGILYAGYSIATGIVNLVIGASLFSMQPWARKGAILTLLVNMVTGIVLMYWLATLEVWFAVAFYYLIVPALMVPIVVIAYLMQKSVKDAFEHHRPLSTWEGLYDSD
ncbi:MAG: hypothetical protein ACFFF4_05795 [Candidatus Thorarchaeota archaeon]